MLKPARVILLAGSGRSGTTWVADVLSSCRGCCCVFEPLSAINVPEAPQWGRASGSPGCYLRADEPHCDWRRFFHKVFSGDISNRWTRQDWRRVPQVFENRPSLARVCYAWARTRNSIKNRMASTRVVKTIRGGLLLPWLAAQFPLDIIHLMRHPCAVIGSQLRLGWRSDLDEIRAQPSLRNDLLAPFSRWLDSASAPFEQLAVLWCVENLLPIEMASRGLCRSAVYEELAARPEDGFSRLLADLALTPSSATRRAIGAWVASPSQAKRHQDAWHAPLTLEEGQRVMEIVHGFGIMASNAACYLASFPPSRPHQPTRAAT